MKKITGKGQKRSQIVWKDRFANYNKKSVKMDVLMKCRISCSIVSGFLKFQSVICDDLIENEKLLASRIICFIAHLA